ncbi:SRSF protein kinase 2 [Lasiodiplodia hormozganensis]|uniref:SRSF protein kinase 2 n=1 Tax=Lasiodiplodia hormozganensis TaxID=869390 RepID=A0AA40CYX8_9PEZI|nr:SRSF protein kinase 2 [Lasiodiplodia hormozganensis]
MPYTTVMATSLLNCARRPPLGRAWRSLSNRALRPLSSCVWKPVVFPNDAFTPIPADQKVEEELLPNYIASEYYPVRIGEILRDRYQILGKVGFGTTSTVWLARDLSGCQHVALKIYIHSESERGRLDNELKIYKRIEKVSEAHPSCDSIRPLLDSFDVDGPNGRHQCLVHPPLWYSVRQLRYRNDVRRLPVPIVAGTLMCIFQALDFLHNAYHVVHTDIKEDNVILGADEAVFEEFEQTQLEQPTPRKELDGAIVYRSRKFGFTENPGGPVLCDLGSAVPLDDGVEHREDIQPDVYRAPEVILDIPWTYSADIWNVGCMVWNMFEGETLFDGTDPEHEEYRSRAHLAEMIALLGPPPPSLLARANYRSKFFSDTEDDEDIREVTMVGDKEDRECFLRFMRKMMQWDPEKRSTASELLDDEWILKHTSS